MCADKRANIKISPTLHEQMKEVVKLKGNANTLTEEYEEAIRSYIEDFHQENIIRQSNFENVLNERISRVEKHLSSMIGRTGMDASMILIGLIYLLQKEFGTDGKPVDQKIIFEKLRVEGARYFTGATKKD